MKPGATHRPTDTWLISAVVALGASLRLWALVRSGGARTAAMVYDDGVYVTAGAVLRDGHVPYRDFVFVQPPGIGYVVALGSLAWRDPEQLLVAMRYVAVVVGVANVALVAWIVRRFIGRVEAVVAALVYAVVPEAVYAEHAAIIEPWLNLACLSAVFLWLSVDHDGGGLRPRSRARIAGALLAAALTFKLWAIFCVAACAITAPRRDYRQRLADLGFGGGVVLVVLWLPLVILAPVDLFDQVVRFQLERPADGVEARVSRLWRMAKPIEITDAGWWRTAFVLGVVALGLFAAMRVATRVARLAVAWFAFTVAAFLVASTWWEQYSAHLAAPFALVAGLATHAVLVRPRPLAMGRLALPLLPLLALVPFAGYVVDSLGYEGEHSSVSVDAARDIARFVPEDACVVALEPGWLVMAGRVPEVAEMRRFAVDPYASLTLEPHLEASIAACPYLVVSDFRLSLLSAALRRAIETEFECLSDPTAGIRVLERR